MRERSTRGGKDLVVARRISEPERRRRAALFERARTRQGKTQEQVARAAGVSERAYQSWELGERVPQQKTMLKAEKELGLDYSPGAPPDLNAVDIDIYALLVALSTHLAKYDPPQRAMLMADVWEWLGRRSGEVGPI